MRQYSQTSRLRCYLCSVIIFQTTFSLKNIVSGRISTALSVLYYTRKAVSRSFGKYAFLPAICSLDTYKGPSERSFFCIHQFSLIRYARHGAPSVPPRLRGAALRKYLPSGTPSRTTPSRRTIPAPSSIICTSIGASSGPTV